MCGLCTQTVLSARRAGCAGRNARTNVRKRSRGFRHSRPYGGYGRATCLCAKPRVRMRPHTHGGLVDLCLARHRLRRPAGHLSLAADVGPIPGLRIQFPYGCIRSTRETRAVLVPSSGNRRRGQRQPSNGGKLLGAGAFPSRFRYDPAVRCVRWRAIRPRPATRSSRSGRARRPGCASCRASAARSAARRPRRAAAATSRTSCAARWRRSGGRSS